MKIPFVATVTLTVVCLGISLSAQEEQTTPSLKDAFKDAFLVGAALNDAQVTGADPRTATLINEQFNAIAPENALKWEVVHPEPGRYDFGPADRYVDFGVKNHMFVVGHNLVWHLQTPKWVFQDANGHAVDRKTLLMRMRDHIHTVVGRYKGRVNAWDVINEDLGEDGTLRKTPWLTIIGEDYIAKAFQYAHEADPKAELYMNDISLENNEAKRNRAIALVKKLKAHGVPITGVGLQGHYKMDWPTLEQVDAAMGALEKLGVKIMMTELDVDVLPPAAEYKGTDVSLNSSLQVQLNPYADGLPDSVQQALAERYAGLFRVFLKHKGNLSRVSFWGVHDAQSWLNDWPVKGRTSYPLLFDRQGQPKPAFDAVIQVAGSAAK